MPAQDALFQKLVDALQRQILTAFAPGERLPSTRELAAMYGAGTMTVQKALQALSKQGLLRPASRIGWFRAGESVSAKRIARKQIALRVGILSCRPRNQWDRFEIYPALLAEAARRAVTLVEVPNPHLSRPTPGRNRIELSHVPWNMFDVALLIEAEDTINISAARLKRHKVIAVDYDATEHGLDSVAFDDPAVGAMAAQHLYELGHRRFGVTDELNDPGFAWDPNTLARRLGFEKTIGQLGGVLMADWRIAVPRHHRPAPNIEEFVVRAVSRWAAVPLDQRPTAFFATTPQITDALIEELKRHGMQAPRDISIITAAWRGSAEPLGNAGGVLRLTTIEMQLSRLAARAFDSALDLAAEEHTQGLRPPRRTLAPVLLLPGESTAPPPKHRA